MPSMPYDEILLEASRVAQRLFSSPLWNVFLFSGRSGSPPKRLGVKLGFPGNYARETDRNETCFFVQTPTGAAEKVRTERSGRAEWP